jgi:hypothetical protein
MKSGVFWRASMVAAGQFAGAVPPDPPPVFAIW